MGKTSGSSTVVACRKACAPPTEVRLTQASRRAMGGCSPAVVSVVVVSTVATLRCPSAADIPLTVAQRGKGGGDGKRPVDVVTSMMRSVNAQDRARGQREGRATHGEATTTHRGGRGDGDDYQRGGFALQPARRDG